MFHVKHYFTYIVNNTVIQYNGFMRYEYDIERITGLLNDGMSMREIARKLEYGEIAMIQWIKRNYELTNKWTYKKKVKKK